MSRQLLFYDQVTPISGKRHKTWCVDGATQRYQFSRGVNSVPVTAIEIPAAAREYSIVFAGSGEAIVPVVILGIEGNENLYLNEDGSWNAHYVPAFVRRYPFVFARSEDGATFTLCLDESWDGCNEEGRGQRLFDDEGERSEYLQNVLNFLQDYQRHFQRTQTYCAKLQELDLLEPQQARFTMAGGEVKTLAGFSAINRDRLKKLPAETLSELAQTDELELTYTHLQSMNNLTYMLQTAAERRAKKSSKTEKPAKAKPAKKTDETEKTEKVVGAKSEKPPKSVNTAAKAKNGKAEKPAKAGKTQKTKTAKKAETAN